MYLYIWCHHTVITVASYAHLNTLSNTKSALHEERGRHLSFLSEQSRYGGHSSHPQTPLPLFSLPQCHYEGNPSTLITSSQNFSQHSTPSFECHRPATSPFQAWTCTSMYSFLGHEWTRPIVSLQVISLRLVYDMCNAIPRPFTDRLFAGVADYLDKHTARVCEVSNTKDGCMGRLTVPSFSHMQ